jgi:uncharacterized protein (TIGR03382 family)
MTNQKLLMFAVAGLLVPAASASADIRAGKTTLMIPSPTTDLAPVGGTPARLRRTDSEQAGNEMPAFALFADGKSGLFFSMTTELNGQPAFHRVQKSLVPFTLVQNADGSVEAKADLTKAKYVTNNKGDEYRNAHAGTAFAIDGGAAVCAQYNYQPENTGDTKLYIQCFNQAGATVLPQTEAFAKTNDDCSMAETIPQLIDTNGATSRYVRWEGCNGNGSDNAWVNVFSITKTANGYAYKRDYDLTVLQNEERSRGTCYVGTDKTLAVCAGTEGNNQPERDGTWAIGVDLTPGKFQGANQQGALLWKKQIGGRATVNGVTTYSMRATLQPVLSADNTNTDTFFWRAGAVQGNNNDNKKGGQYVQNNVGVLKATRAGLQFITKPTGLAYTALLGMDGTHNLVTATLVGSGADLKPALLIQNGSHNGGQGTSTIRAVGWDATAGFTNLGTFAGPPHDRHLYSNYLGNNPGNQGRDHSFAAVVPNPYFGQAGSNDKYIALFATTGKGDNMNPAVKLAAFLSVMPVASGAPATTTQPATTTTTTTGTSGSTTTGSTTDTASTDDGSADSSDTTLGGCSTTGTGGLATFLLIGLAAFIRRRR